ncbi:MULTISPECIES: non-ribosomal peptide synthetase [Clostridium]|uniref:non-ribosomal peptide synthetase n=1 Tax=Clostridium TaxID=1485 RepID=UPI0028FD3BC3|nr:MULTISPECIES: non-ribosomal peptide synthetase [Clostridium]MDU0325085.1 amino acid adenylation domain-containing protein [Clostridium butyricum]MDU3088405.1 amino acid adenylation domain-containing protein [Clostridium sp.]
MEKLMKWDYDVDICDIFQNISDIQGSKTAIVCGENNISYENFNKQANRLAHFLRDVNVGKNTVVSIYSNRGISFAAAVLAVFKAGGAYLPIDPKFPVNRISQIIEQSSSNILIVSSELKEELYEKIKGSWIESTLNIVTIEEAIEINNNTDNLPIECSPDDLAYVIFTSGSTGVPKGAMVKRKGMVNHLYSKISDLGITETDTLVQSASQCFDISVWQLWSALLVGGQVHIVNNEIAREPSKLLTYLSQNEITHMQVVPSMLRAIVQEIENSSKLYNFKNLRYVALVGEALPPSLCRKWFEYYPNIPLLNSYGPTECSDGVSHYIANTSPSDEVIHMPIGKAIRNLKTYIIVPGIDEIKLCSEGEDGELCVAGIGVGKGYINNLEKTQSTFINNPFSDDEDYSILYRTGDLVRYLPNGDMEYHGRIDRQVKIRGYRIELPEIEAYINKIQEVKTCAVVVKKINSNRVKLVARECIVGDNVQSEEIPSLIAYIVSDKEIKVNEIRSFLNKHLPTYMIPDRFVRLNSLPLNSNGKIDIKALPEPQSIRPNLDTIYVLPKNETEDILANIWSEALGFESVGIKDNYLELGGDSLIALRIIASVLEKLNYQLTFKDIYVHNILEIAEKIRVNQDNTVISKPTDIEHETNEFPLSFEQQRLWYLWKINKNSPFYTLQGYVHINGKLNLKAFDNASKEIFKRHDNLNACFKETNGIPYINYCNNQLEISVVDLSQNSQINKEAEIRKIADEEIKNPFDLANDTLMRLKLFKLDEKEYITLLTTHEIIMDAWSLSVILRELNSCYHGLINNDSYTMLPSKLKFRNYSLWEKENLNKNTLKKQDDYWKNKLSGTLPILNLPVKQKRSKIVNYEGKSEAIIIDKELTQKLKSLSNDNNSTLYMTFLAAFNLLLYNYTGQEDIIVGSPHVNRNYPGTDELVGFFLNMLPMRTNLSNKENFVELLNSTREMVLETFENSNYPFLWMLEFSDVVRDTSVSPIFQVMFNMYSEKAEVLNENLNENKEENIKLSFRERESGFTKYELTLYVQEDHDQLYVQFSYFTALFEESFINRMIKNFEVLLNSIVSNPLKPLSKLDLLSEEEYRIQELMNDTEYNFNNGSTIQEIFEKQVVSSPLETAYIYGLKKITYLELNERANKIANYLRRKGFGREDKIGICIDRSLEMVVGLLGIIKSGGTYVALDADYPNDRLKAIIGDTNIPAILTYNECDKFPEYKGLKIYIDSDWKEIDMESSENPTCINKVDDIFNIVYTSASTGKPKGVQIPMKSVLNRLFWMWKEYPFVDTDVAVIQKSYALVASTWEIYGGLLKGIPSLILSKKDILTPRTLWKELIDNKVTYLLASPPFLEIIIQQAKNSEDKWDCLRLATTSAEPITSSLVREWYKTFENIPLLNLYGSTECSSNATVFNTIELSESDENVPIGKPLSNVKTFVLGKNLKPVPVGVVGEMCVSGKCLSRGYLNLQQLNQEKFITVDSINEEMIYRTGDLAFVDNNCNLRLVGREDDQVKIRGYRIELREIEQYIRGFMGVKDVVVGIREDNPGQKNLVAYLLRKGDIDIEIYEIRNYLLTKLPDYMVPSFYVILDTFPKTLSGKLDKKALQQVSISTETNREEPETDIEKTIAKVWMNLLNINSIGREDNFFLLGGHSLLVIRMQIELEKEGITIEYNDIYNFQILKDLAHYVSQKSTNVGSVV